MSLLASLVVSAVVAAAPATPLPWYGTADYPDKAFAREWEGAASFEVIVAPNGRPAECRITQSSGHDVLDKQTCYIAMNRARFSPARGPDGTPVYGAYRSMVKWHRPDRDKLQAEPGPDLELTVASMPAGTAMPAAVKIAYFVDAQGQPSACTALPESKAQPSALVEAACRAMFATVAPGTANRPMVRTAAVVFSTN
jgi:TonB family protein